MTLIIGLWHDHFITLIHSFVPNQAILNDILLLTGTLRSNVIHNLSYVSMRCKKQGCVGKLSC